MAWTLDQEGGVPESLLLTTIGEEFEASCNEVSRTAMHRSGTDQRDHQNEKKGHSFNPTGWEY